MVGFAVLAGVAVLLLGWAIGVGVTELAVADGPGALHILAQLASVVGPLAGVLAALSVVFCRVFVD